MTLNIPLRMQMEEIRRLKSTLEEPWQKDHQNKKRIPGGRHYFLSPLGGFFGGIFTGAGRITFSGRGDCRPAPLSSGFRGIPLLSFKLSVIRVRCIKCSRSHLHFNNFCGFR